jgi:hypothetical protein
MIEYCVACVDGCLFGLLVQEATPSVRGASDVCKIISIDDKNRLCKVSLPLMESFSQSTRAVLIGQDPVERIWHQSRNTLKLRLS